MRREIEKESAEWNFFREFYALRQETYDAETEEELTLEILPRWHELSDKYKDTEIAFFVREMIMCHLADCEKRFMTKRETEEKENWIELFHVVCDKDADAEEYFSSMNYIYPNQIEEANKNWVKTALEKGQSMEQLVQLVPCASKYAA